MSTIMQQDYVAASGLLSHFFLDLRSWRLVPVMAGNVPHYGPQPEFPCDIERRRTPSSEWGTKQIRVFAHGILQRFLAIDQLSPSVGSRFHDEQRMREGVITDGVAGLCDGARDLGTLLHVASDHEECRSHIVLCQHVEQSERVRIVRAIVVGKGDLLTAGDSVG